jgi:hypothetical protein
VDKDGGWKVERWIRRVRLSGGKVDKEEGWEVERWIRRETWRWKGG